MLTVFTCPSMCVHVRSHAMLSKFHSATEPSSPPDAMCLDNNHGLSFFMHCPYRA